MQDSHNNKNKTKSDRVKYIKKNDSWAHIIKATPTEENRDYLI